ncbi:hypothetical protein THAOC_22375 [Thalassiosira oceanica]|uniref:Uncharacterized protein n=1 Tax=Thalassiosira oceanica TaxID=159749 RepID=K0SG50_THAOC|nr:hypothetical protein THAOC_22375 [Thalassiosira oceanica]|eukprot:EJK57567.1 hypothetical protein THAOC_22375 [Thalassiosira oceanica]
MWIKSICLLIYAADSKSLYAPSIVSTEARCPMVGLEPAGGVWGDDGVYPARRSALYTLTGPLGRSMASDDLKQSSLHRRFDNHQSVGSDVRATHVQLGCV